SEGVLHGCGHYVITKRVGKIDCLNPYCIYSKNHVENCPHCPTCKRYYGPDARETVTLQTKEYCNECKWWYQGEGARNRR
ncbi:hypothetical protein M378DRAFT_75602, partial [Amanita muscaria Koide BX008]